MFSLVASAGFNMGARAPVTQGRVAQPKMYDISAFDDIWSLAAKEEIYGKWDPEKPCDSNGCFPGQDGGYKPPNRPDVSWAIQQEHAKRMDELKAEDKFNLKGKPGCWKKGWADNLGPAP